MKSDPRSSFRNTITGRLITPIAVIAIIVVLVLMPARYYYAQHYVGAELEKFGTKFASSIAAALKPSNSQKAIQSVLDAIQGTDGSDTISVVDPSSNVVIAASDRALIGKTIEMENVDGSVAQVEVQNRPLIVIAKLNAQAAKSAAAFATWATAITWAVFFSVVLALQYTISYRSIQAPARAIIEMLRGYERNEAFTPLPATAPTELKQISDALVATTETRRQQDAIFREVLKYAADAIIVIDKDGTIEQFNQAAEKTFGYQAGEIVGLNVTKIMPQPEADAHAAAMNRLNASGRPLTTPISTVTRGLHKDGSLMPIRLSISEVHGGRDRRFAGILRDISSELAFQQNLENAKIAAEAADKAKSEFLASMSHEIRTPLNGVLGMLTLLEQTHLDERQHDLVVTAEGAGQSLLRLLNDLLDLSKIEAGKLELVNGPMNLREVVESSLQNHRANAEQKGLELHLELDRDLPDFVVGDALRMRQILGNLINNSTKFTTAGSVTVSVTRYKDETDQHVARYSVTDTGIGIESELVETIFGRFTQADSSITRKFGGTGLGLAICRELSTLMGGKITCRSELGVGSTFELTLPLTPVNSEKVEKIMSTEKPKPQDAPNAASRGPLKILIAEDVDLNTKLLKAFLKPLGHELECVPNGKQALEAVRSSAFDVVLMDVQMPEMDGLTATREIRKLEGDTANTYIIALTANAMSGDKDRCLAAGANAYLSKPIGMAQLFDALSLVPAATAAQINKSAAAS